VASIAHNEASADGFNVLDGIRRGIFVTREIYLLKDYKNIDWHFGQGVEPFMSIERWQSFLGLNHDNQTTWKFIHCS
jgi:hypothetical protein